MKAYLTILFITALIMNAAFAGLTPVGVPDVSFRMAKKHSVETIHTEIAQKKAPVMKRNHRSGVRIATR